MNLLTHLPRCRTCGGRPRLANTSIDRHTIAFAVHCENLCGDDTHWQMSMAHAEQMWRDGRVRHQQGGNGSSDDDRNIRSH